jgi:integrase
MNTTVSFLTQDETKQLLAVIASKRDRALFLTAYRHGLRASELGLLQRTDVALTNGRGEGERSNSGAAAWPHGAQPYDVLPGSTQRCTSAWIAAR